MHANEQHLIEKSGNVDAAWNSMHANEQHSIDKSGNVDAAWDTQGYLVSSLLILITRAKTLH